MTTAQTNKPCALGCTPAEPDNCQASMVVTCPLGYWQAEKQDAAEATQITQQELQAMGQ